jgi:hypothetical protein
MMCCEWPDPYVSDDGLKCRSCERSLVPAEAAAGPTAGLDAIRKALGPRHDRATHEIDYDAYCLNCRGVDDIHDLLDALAARSAAAPSVEVPDE